MICKRITSDSDLSEASLQEALSHLYGESPRVLFVPSSLIEEGKLLCRPKELELRLDTDLQQDGWYVTNKYFGIFSPGA